MKIKLFILLFCAITMYAVAQDEIDNLSALKPGELETMLQKTGFTIRESYEGLPENMSNRVLSTNSMGYTASDQIVDTYPTKVTLRISDGGILVYNKFPYETGELFTTRNIVKSFVCIRGYSTYHVFVSKKAFLYVIPVAGSDSKIRFLAVNLHTRELENSVSFTLTSDSKVKFGRTYNINAMTLPVFPGRSRNEAINKLGKSSSLYVNGDSWDNHGISVIYNEGEEIQEIRIRANDSCDVKPYVVNGITIYSYIEDVINMHGNPVKMEHQVPNSIKYTWIDGKTQIQVLANKTDEQNHCKKLLPAGSITHIFLSEEPQRSIKTDNGDPAYRICNRYIIRKDTEGLAGFLKTKPDISFKPEYDWPGMIDNPVLLAVSHKNFDILRMLLEHGGNANESERVPGRERNDEFVSPDYYIMSDYPEMEECLEILCKHGLDLPGALKIGLMKQNVKFLDVIARSHPDFSAFDLSEQLYFNISAGRLSSIQWLIEHGADVNGINKSGKTNMKTGLESANPDVKAYFNELKKKK